MINIFEYFDYHKFLFDYYKERKKDSPEFSYRFIEQKTGIDPGFLVKIFQGTKELTRRYIEPVAALCRLGRRETQYFMLLIEYSRAKDQKQIKSTFEQLLEFIDFSAKKIEAYQYEFYQHWYYTAVREVIAHCTFIDDYEALANKISPPIKISEVKRAVELLCNLDMIRKNAHGEYEICSRFITTGEKWQSLAVRSFQQQTIDLAREALNDVPVHERDISTVTMSLSANGVNRLKEYIANARKEMLKIAHEDIDADRVFQLNIQLFPLSGAIDKEGGK